MRLKSNKIARALGFKGRSGYLLGGCALALNTLLIAPTAIAQGDTGVEEIIVTARFREENLQETPLAITSISGEALEERGIESIVDLGLAIPNAQMRISPGQWGPNPTIGMRGVSQQEFIYTAEPGVGIYVDDVYHGTLTGSNLDLLDLERVEVLRGPQGTLFGKNSLGGTIRMISKAPQGDDTGNVELVLGTSNRLDVKGSFDTALIDDILFMRIAGASKQIDGYQDRLDFVCQMRANGTPGLSGTLPERVPSNKSAAGDCKVGENGGSDSNAARVMFRYLPTDRLEMNLAADYSKTIQDPGAEMLLSRSDPALGFGSEGSHDVNVIQPTFGVSYTSDDRFLSTQDYNYASYSDPITGRIFETDQITEAWSTSFKVDYDISEAIHVKFIAAYRTYDSNWTSDGDLTPLDVQTATTLNIQDHDQTTYELQFSGLAINDRLEWTAGAYSYDSASELGGLVTLPAFGGISFNQNDSFTTKSESVFAHVVFDLTDKMSTNLGLRYTDEEKVYTFDHTGFLTLDEPLIYGGDHVDWKLSLDYQFTDAIMGYVLAATGFRSEGANPRPFTGIQLTKFSGEEILSYEVGAKMDMFDNKLRLNTAIFVNDYDPRLVGAGGSQCDLFDQDQTPWRDGPCPAGTTFEGGGGLPWFASEPASGQAQGIEFEVTWNPVDNLSVNGSYGYYDYESDAGPGEIGYLHSSVLLEAKHSFSLGAQYYFAMDSGASIVPRLDWFYQGERTSGDPTSPRLSPQHMVPDYTLVNGRVTYSSPEGTWTASLVASNLLDEEYWIQLGTATNSDGTTSFGRKGNPGRGREISLNIRRNFY